MSSTLCKTDENFCTYDSFDEHIRIRISPRNVTTRSNVLSTFFHCSEEKRVLSYHSIKSSR